MKAIVTLVLLLGSHFSYSYHQYPINNSFLDSSIDTFLRDISDTYNQYQSDINSCHVALNQEQNRSNRLRNELDICLSQEQGFSLEEKVERLSSGCGSVSSSLEAKRCYDSGMNQIFDIGNYADFAITACTVIGSSLEATNCFKGMGEDFDHPRERIEQVYNLVFVSCSAVGSSLESQKCFEGGYRANPEEGKRLGFYLKSACGSIGSSLEGKNCYNNGIDSLNGAFQRLSFLRQTCGNTSSSLEAVRCYNNGLNF